ncbi:MAG TPA: amylo-alpha-1,6-glucosidase [Gammaproteobacteria bacterium]|nr:amylo-alpha-1,6-glucosidase [Gammaproteobacteria bacterium]
MEDVIKVEDRWYVSATSTHADDRTRVLKHGETFVLFNRHGDIQRISISGQGLYHQGTRYLSHLELLIKERRPILLNSTVKEDNTILDVDLTNPDLYEAGRLKIHNDSIHIFRAKVLRDGRCHELVRLTNYSDASVDVPLSLEFDADFADIFEVRGVKRAQRGKLQPAVIGEDMVELGYEGLDGVRRRTRLGFSQRPTELSASHARFQIHLPPRGCSSLYLTISCLNGREEGESESYEQAVSRTTEELARQQACCSAIQTSNEQFNNWLNRSAADLHMLTTELPEGPYPFAGVPWFSTPFGRDGIITALQALWVYPDLARGVLSFLAATQAREVNPEQEAEPGKILHETRKGELAALGEIPFGRYYGTVDATPLFVVLAGEYYRRSGDRDFVERIWPNIERALEWIDRYGDVDGDGFVEYQRHGERGLVHQGWKDSDDSIFHADGRPAEGPIALCEVQGYVYQARLHAASLAELFGHEARARQLREAAESLKQNFNERFWCEELSTYAIALDGEKQPCRVRASNAGHALFSGIASERNARLVAETLLSEASFSGWGVRTIAASEQRYNPMSYHNGSIWPHDNALIAMGLARYGFRDHALRILTGMFDASIFMDLHRLPELFCGFLRRSGQGPTLYPVACSPQAWASTTVFYLLQASLGLSFDPVARCIRFLYPQLPSFIDEMVIRNLRLDGAEVDLRLRRHPQDVGIRVLRKEGEMDITVVV